MQKLKENASEKIISFPKQIVNKENHDFEHISIQIIIGNTIKYNTILIFSIN